MNVFPFLRREPDSSITVRPLLPTDRAAIDRLFASDETRFLTQRLYIEFYGFASEKLRIFATWEAANDQLLGIMFRINNTIIVADQAGECAAAFAEAIDLEDGIAGMRGTREAVQRVRTALRRYIVEDWVDSYNLSLHNPPVINAELLQHARRATIDDVEPVSELYAGAAYMFRNRSNVAEKISQSRVFVVEEIRSEPRRNRIVSCALLNVEGAQAGLIGGVYTHLEARGRGYAAACTAALSLDLQRDGKLPCLFYENPVAGRVYRRLGFADCGHWEMVFFAAERYYKSVKSTT